MRRECVKFSSYVLLPNNEEGEQRKKKHSIKIVNNINGINKTLNEKHGLMSKHSRNG